jgi:hypothetical protein
MVPAWASYTAVAMGGLPAPYAAYYKYLLNFSYPGGFHRYCLFLARSTFPGGCITSFSLQHE